MAKKKDTGLAAEDLVRALKAVESDPPRSLQGILQMLGLEPVVACDGGGSYRTSKLTQRMIGSISTVLPDLQISRVPGGSLTKEADLSEWRLLLQSQDLFSRGTIVVLKDIDRVRSQLIPKIIDTFDRIQDCLVFIEGCEKLTDANQKKLFAVASRVVLPELHGESLQRWIHGEFKARGHLNVEREIIAFLAKEYASHIDELAALIEKVSLTALPGEKISTSILSASSHNHFDKTMFDLFSYIAKEDRLGSSLALRSIIHSGNHPLQVFAFLSRACKTLVATSRQKTYGASESIGDLGNSWYLNKLSPRAFSEERLSRAITHLSAVELELKGNAFDAELILDAVVQRL